MATGLPRNALPRLVTPAAAIGLILFSFTLQRPTPPVELASGEPPAPSIAAMMAAYEEATSPRGPGYDLGAAAARVTVVEFSDFGCRYSKRFATQSYPGLRDLVASGAVRWRYVPFVLGMFTNGQDAARAGECAGEQGRAAFTRMHDRLFGAQDEWQNAADPGAAFRGYARAARLDMARFDRCYGGAAAAERTRASGALADRLGVRATPTFFINGYRVEGALPPDQFRAILEDALRDGRTN